MDDKCRDHLHVLYMNKNKHSQYLKMIFSVSHWVCMYVPFFFFRAVDLHVLVCFSEDDHRARRRHYHALCSHVHQNGERKGMRFQHHQVCTHNCDVLSVFAAWAACCFSPLHLPMVCVAVFATYEHVYRDNQVGFFSMKKKKHNTHGRVWLPQQVLPVYIYTNTKLYRDT